VTASPLRQTRKKNAVTMSATKRKQTASSSGASKAKSTQTPVGWVSFVGAGPGDPDLLTVKAADLIRGADVVITEIPSHAALVQELRAGLDAGQGVQIVEGGLGDDGVALTHAARGRLVVKHAKSGGRVVRLLAGDPFLLGTGPEEAQACRKAGVAFEVVPGVSSASGVPAYAGIPLTTRNRREVAVVRAGDARIDWPAYVGKQTLVVLLTAAAIEEVATAIIEAGRDADTRVAITQHGTTTEQTTVVSTLDELAAAAKEAELSGQVVMVVGDVVEMRETLSWFETKPLFGWRVLVPRTKEQSAGLVHKLRSYGAVPEEVPTISVEPPRNPQQMDRAIRGLVEGRYEWIAFTSVNAVKAVREKFEEYGLDSRAFSGLKIAVVGDKTADAVRTWGIEPDLMPSGEQSARGLVDDWPPYDEVLDPINRVFLPRADIATETLVAGLVELGWEVDDVTAYRTVRAAPPPAPTREAIKAGKFDAVLFTSSSTVRNLVGIAGKPHATTIIACIGPQTVKTAEEHGLRVDVMAPNPSADELAEALADFGAERRVTLLEAGEQVLRPSQRRPSGRRGSARRSSTRRAAR
jgi:uroporphyrinogen III methyltransferase / synthase